MDAFSPSTEISTETLPERLSGSFPEISLRIASNVSLNTLLNNYSWISEKKKRGHLFQV